MHATLALTLSLVKSRSISERLAQHLKLGGLALSDLINLEGMQFKVSEVYSSAGEYFHRRVSG